MDFRGGIRTRLFGGSSKEGIVAKTLEGLAEFGQWSNSTMEYYYSGPPRAIHCCWSQRRGLEVAYDSGAGSYRQLPAVTGSYRQLPAVTGIYFLRCYRTVSDINRQLPAVTGSYRQLPAVTGS